MKVLKMRVILGVALLAGGLALLGPPFVPIAAAQSESSSGQVWVAMSIFMGEEPKPAAPPPKPAAAKPQPATTPTAPAMSVPPTQASGTAKESPAPAANTGAPVTLTAPPTPITAPAKAPALAEVTEGYTYDPKSRRDPFLSLTRLLKVDKTRAEMPPLQRVQISDLKLLGIMWGGYGYYGLVQTPDGKGYTVKEGMLMGTNNGVITTITDKAIIVSEPSIDITGNKSTKDVEILLRPKEVS
jgi:type IV pilus assembly protein PilP